MGPKHVGGGAVPEECVRDAVGRSSRSFHSQGTRCVDCARIGPRSLG